MSGNEIAGLAAGFGKASAKVAVGLYATYKAEGEAFAKDWADNARETSGQHAAKYPNSITSETRVSLGIEVETGPESGPANQGFLGRILEFGGEHSPAHLDGARALSVAEQRLTRAADVAIGRILP